MTEYEMEREAFAAFVGSEIECPAACGRVSEYGGLCDACVVVNEVRAIETRRVVGLRGVLVASLAFAALAFPACASVDPEPLPEERAAADAIRGAFREVPPTPSGVRRDPDWGAYVDPGATATVPPSVCPEGISDLDVRVVKRTSIPEVGARLPQESEGKGEGRQSSWSAGGESVGAYVSVNRDFFAYGSRRIAAYVWCDGGSR